MKKKFLTIMLAAALAVNFGVLPVVAESNEAQETEMTEEEAADVSGETEN